MKNNIFNLIKSLLLLLIITLISCNSEDNNEFVPTLPEATQIGANTFGCYVDGKLLTPRNGTGTIFGSDDGMSFIGSGSPPNYDFNEIVVRDFKSGTGGIMKIHIIELNINGEGSFNINQSNCQDGIDAIVNINITCRLWDEGVQEYKWYCSINNSGKLDITNYNFDNRLLSGTFNCIAQNRDNPGEMIEITEGRFDLKWDELPGTHFP